MPLTLTRSLVMLDVETTGAEVQSCRVVQLGCVKLLPSGERRRWVTLVNPEVPIPPAATAVHGIDDEAVKDAPTMVKVAPRLAAALEGCDVGGFNARRFDIPVLERECLRGGVSVDLRGRLVVDPLKVFHAYHPRDLAAAVRTYLGRDMEGAHDALADAEAALDVMLAQVEAHGLPGNVMALHAVCAGDSVDLEGKLRWVEGEATFTFGKHSGKSLRWVSENDPSFLSWLLKQDFPRDVKDICRAALHGRFPGLEAA